MIPYFQQPSLEVGPLTFHAFGALVVAAILAGSWMIQKRTAEQGLDIDKSYNLVTWVLVGAFICSHLVEVIVYHPEKLQEDPWALFKLWEGMSSYGGFLGTIIGIALFSRKYLEPGEIWRYVDVVAWGFPFGWIFGRTGCTIALDHPGIPTDFVLGFHRSPTGPIVHNLGLYEMLYTCAIAGFFWVTRKRPVWSGYWVGMLWILYSPVRFGLDFLRTRDVKYVGLTPGQWGAIAMLLAALAVFRWRWQVGDREPWKTVDTTPADAR